VFSGVIGFSRPFPEKAGASALQGLSLIAAGGGEGEWSFRCAETSRGNTLAGHLTAADILIFLCGAVQIMRSETADFPQVQGQQKR
jgi:hypothetical protein